jgi:hypothetical protein
MSTWFPPLRARVMLAFWSTLAIAGLAPVLYVAGLLAWQVVSFFQRGSWVPLPASVLLTEHSFGPTHTALMWVLSKVHVGAIPAVVGLAMIALGWIRARRQYAAIRALRQHTDDRLRRVRDYQNDHGHAASFDARREPFISEPRSSRAAAGGAR